MRASKVTPEDEAFRKLVVSLDGHQKSVAEAMGIHQTCVSKRLHSEKHYQWWLEFKAKRSKSRRRAKRRRIYQARKARYQETLAVLKAVHPEDALLEALLDQLEP